MRTRVKICGITNLEDALAAVYYGCDALGFVFYRQSPRYVTPQVVNSIIAQLPAFVTTVGLFVDADVSEVNSIAGITKIDLLQFHGNETPEFCRQFNQQYIKAIRVQPDTNLLQYERDFFDAKALLLDAFVQGLPGGTGKQFDWNLIPKGIKKPIVLAGGLDPENIALAIQHAKPYAVDVSGGVELIEGKKDAAKIAALMRGVNHAVV